MSFAPAACRAWVSKHTPHGPSAWSTQACDRCVRQPHWSLAWICSGMEGQQIYKKQFSLAIRKAGWVQCESVDMSNKSSNMTALHCLCPVSDKCSILAYTADKIWTGYCIPHDISRKQSPSLLESVTLHKQRCHVSLSRGSKMCGLDCH